MATIMAELTRDEFDRRYSDLSALLNSHISRLDTRIDKVEQADLATRATINGKLEKLGDKVEASERLLSSQIDTLKTDIYRTQAGNLWRVLGWGVSFLLGGGGMIGLFQALHLLR